MALIVLITTVIMYALIILYPHRKVYFSLGAALLFIILSIVTPREALSQMVNWNVLMIFLGSQLIASLFLYSRVPLWIADTLIDVSPNPGIAITLILLMTGFVSAFVDNVSTVLVMAPIALVLSKRLSMDPTYFMVGLAVMANLQGTATLVGDPPSMIFADYAHYGFNDFFVYQGRPSIFFAVQFGMLCGALFLYAYFAKTKHTRLTVEKEPIISLVPTILLLTMIGSLAIISFVERGLSPVAGYAVLSIATLGLLWFRFVQKKTTRETFEVLKKFDWEAFLFLIGIFIVVGTITKVGWVEKIGALLAGLIGGNVIVGFMLIILVSLLLSGFIDNIPYILVMLPVADRLAKTLSLRPELYMFGLLIGSCMGGNITPFGASANVVSVGILKREGISLSFLQWLKIGLPFTLITTGGAALFVWLFWK